MYIFAGDLTENIVSWGAKEITNERELVNVWSSQKEERELARAREREKNRTSLTILSREQGPACEHLRKDASHTPHVHSEVVVLPEEHDLGSPVVTRGDIASVGHVRVGDAGQAKVADLQVTRFIHQNVARLQVSVKDTSRVNVLGKKKRNEERKEKKREKGKRKEKKK